MSVCCLGWLVWVCLFSQRAPKCRPLGIIRFLPQKARSEEHTSELQSRLHLVCRLLLHAATTELYTLSLHDALPIYLASSRGDRCAWIKMRLKMDPKTMQKKHVGLLFGLAGLGVLVQPAGAEVPASRDYQVSAAKGQIGRAHV